MTRRAEKLRHLILTSSPVRGGLSFLLATGAVNVSNLAFHIVGSRLLGPANYGSFGALLNLMLILAIPLGAIQASATQSVARTTFGHLNMDFDLRGAGRSVTTFGCSGMGLLLLISPVVNRFLHVSSPIPLLLIAVWMVPAAVCALWQGTLIGQSRFGPVAWAMFVGTGIGRLATGVVLLQLGFGLPGAMAASLLAQIVTLVLLRAALSPRSGEVPTVLQLHKHDSALSLATLTGLALLGAVDIVMARHYLGPVAAGNYAAAANAARIALFLPAAFSLLAFPSFASSHGPTARKAIVLALPAVMALGCLTALSLSILPSLTVGLLFGGEYRQAVSALGPLAWGASAYGLVTLLSYYFLARRSLASLVSWPAAALLALAVWQLHGGLAEMAEVVSTVLIGTGLIACVVAGKMMITRAPDADSSGQDLVAQSDSDSVLDLSIVIPFYNVGDPFAEHLAEVVQVLDSSGVSYEVIAVSDGSTDGSDEIAATADHVQCVRLPVNQGKGAALRAGLTLGRGRYLGFIDADGDLPPDLLLSFIETIRRDLPDIAVGSKRHPQSDVEYSRLRTLYSIAYQQLTRALFGLKIRDTQTGIKLIRKEVVSDALPRMLEKRFAFDLELLVVARHLGYTRVVELPVTIRQRFGSTIHFASVARMLLDTLAIFYRLRVLGFYGGSGRTVVAPIPEVRAEGAVTYSDDVCRLPAAATSA